MPIVKGRSNLVPDYLDAASVPPDPAIARGRLVVATDIVLNAATDSDGSSYHLADLPSDCLLDDSTAFDVQNWGFAAIRIGTRDDVDALVSVLKSAGNTVTPKVFGDANHGRMLWQHLGLAADPGGMIGIYAHAIADATGAGNMPFRLAYLYR
jgi:hypothetical protein